MAAFFSLPEMFCRSRFPFRIAPVLGRLTGRPAVPTEEPLAVAASRTAVPTLPPDSIHFTRRPDIVLVLIESLRADFLSTPPCRASGPGRLAANG